MSINVAAIKAFLVSNDDGSVNFAASTAKFETELQGYEEMNSQGDEQIAEAISAIFDTYPGVNVTNLAGFAISKLQVGPTNYSETMDRVKSYLKANTGEYGEAHFGMRKGKGGGHWRWADKSASDELVKDSKLAIKKRSLAAAAAVSVDSDD